MWPVIHPRHHDWMTWVTTNFQATGNSNLKLHLPGDSAAVTWLCPQTLEVTFTTFPKGHVNSASQKGHENAELPGGVLFAIPIFYRDVCRRRRWMIIQSPWWTSSMRKWIVRGAKSLWIFPTSKILQSYLVRIGVKGTPKSRTSGDIWGFKHLKVSGRLGFDSQISGVLLIYLKSLAEKTNRTLLDQLT